MPIEVHCNCGRVLTAADEISGRRVECPECGRWVEVDAGAPQGAGGSAAVEQSAPASQARGSGETPHGAPASQSVLGRMFEALLDPRSIQWMLMIGGALCVLGIIVWLVSEGVFENKLVLAASMGAATLALMGSGWWTTLQTRFRLAGQALTFLACVLAPLNLWFYHAQRLVTVDGHLWIGGVVCSLLYAATVYRLRDPLFMFACEAGVTLSAALLLADLGKVTDPVWLSLFLMSLGVASIHAERAFSPAETASFPRRRYGLPLFWSGHVQVGAALVMLLASQVAAWLAEPLAEIFGVRFPGNLFTQEPAVAAGVWLAAAYAYLYSDVVVRRVGRYLPVAGFAVVMAEATLLVGFDVSPEWIMAAMATTALGMNAAAVKWRVPAQQVMRLVTPVGWTLGCLPILWGAWLHWRATSGAAAGLQAEQETGLAFIGAMTAAAIANRLSAWVLRRTDERASQGYFGLSAAAVLLAAAGLLRQLAVVTPLEQAPWLMLIPMAYLVASWLWHGQSPERPLMGIAHVGTAALVLNLLSSISNGGSLAALPGAPATLSLALVLAEATVFYLLAATLCRQAGSAHLAGVAGCAAAWQMLGYANVDGQFYSLAYAGLGLMLIVVSRLVGSRAVRSTGPRGGESVGLEGRGLPAFHVGNGILCVTLLAAFMQGLSGLVTTAPDWASLRTLIAAAVAAGVAALIAPSEPWRRMFAVAGAALVGLGVVRFMNLDLMSTPRKFELASVVVGLIALAASHVARFRETNVRRDEVTWGLAVGSLLATLPLVTAVLYFRWEVGTPSKLDEILLLTVTIAMAVTGAAWQIRATTLCGGTALVLYLVVLVCSLAYHPQVAIGVYLAAGGAAVFALGIGLSVYRQRLLELPERVAKREGVFRILNWR